MEFDYLCAACVPLILLCHRAWQELEATLEEDTSLKACRVTYAILVEAEDTWMDFDAMQRMLAALNLKPRVWLV